MEFLGNVLIANLCLKAMKQQSVSFPIVMSSLPPGKESVEQLYSSY